MSKTRDTGFLNNVIKTDPQGNVTIVSGSTTLLSISSSGAITTTGVISGSNALTSSYSQNSELLDNLDSTSFVFTSSYNLDSSSFSTRTTTLEAASSSLNTASGSFSGRITTIESKYATTSNNIFTANQTICGNLTTTGTITAQTINVQQVTSSIVYSCGSNIFGCALTDTQQFTGSMFITGSTLTVNGGTICATGNTCFGGSTIIAGCIGIGTATPTSVGGTALVINDSSTPRIRLTNTTTGTTSTDGGELSLFACDFNIENREASGAMNLYVNGALRQKITSTGIACFACQVCAPAGLYSNCPIGINSIDAAIPLQIKRWAGSSGTLRLIGNDNVTGLPSISFCNDNGGGSAFVSMTANCQININGSIYVCPSGNVGIGTSSPNVKLHVYGVPLTNGDASYNLILEDSSAYNTRVGSGISFGGFYGSGSGDNTYTFSNIKGFKENTTINDYAGALAFSTRTNGGSPTERMRITSGGSVGIGQTSPSFMLDVICNTSGQCVTVANFAACNYASGCATYIQIGTQYGDGSSRIGSISPGGNCSNLIFETHPTTSGVWCERMRIGFNGVVRIGACAVNINANNNVLFQVSSAIRFGNPDGEYVQSYGGGISSRACNTFSPGAARILLKGLGDAGFLILVQGFQNGVANKFADLLLGVASCINVVSSSNSGSPASRCYTITSENLNLCLSGAADYNINATGFNAAER